MSATKSSPERAGSAPSRGIAGEIYSFLASVKFTVLLLSLIAAGSVFGTVIKQRAPVEEYLSFYSESTVRLIKFFGLDDTYHCAWFYSLIALFLINLILCTLQRFSRLARAAGGATQLPDEKALSDMEMKFSLADGSAESLEKEIGKSYRRVYSGPEGAVYRKGGLSRYGVYIIHSSIILILLGGFLGTVLGYKGYMVLTKGEAKDRVVLRGENPGERVLGFTLKCKDFKVSFYPGGEPKDYVSTVEVMENGKALMEKQIRVNDPLSYKGIRVYQASYGRASSFLFRIGGENVILKERDTFRKDGLLLMIVRYEGQVHNFGPGVLVGYLDKGEPKTSWFLKDVDRLRERNLNGVDIRLEDISEGFYTGLEVAKDPGIWIVWAGFALILFGLYINFFTYYRRIFVRKGPNGVIVAGFAPRNKEAFREEFSRLKAKVAANEP